MRTQERKPQVSPLRYAPVEMTILFEDRSRRFQEKYEISAATELSSRPERTRISCHAVPETTACAAFIKESRMKFANATNTNRKSGVAEWRDLRFPFLGSHTRRPGLITVVPPGL